MRSSSTSLGVAALGVAGLLAGGCSTDPHADAAGDARDAADARDATTRDAVDVAPVDPCASAPCGPVELCGPYVDGGTGLGNGVDDDCNGQVDETCRCSQDQRESCFPGPGDRRHVGACHDGTALCGELGIWGACLGAIAPTTEVCDGIDNDCNAQVDDGLIGCATSVACPAYASAHPLADYTLDARTVAADATTFAWRFECPASIHPCPAPADPSASTLRVHVIQSGRYVVHLATHDAHGAASACDFPLYVSGGGLRVELDWSPKGGVNSAGVDLDLHAATLDLQRAHPASWFTLDDCYYATCTAPGGRVVWSTGPADTRFAPTTDVSACAGAPRPYGDAWRAAGRCWNPRLDTDDIACDPGVTDGTNPAFCFVENINVDEPPHDVTFRLAVNFYRDHGACTDADPANDVAHPRLQVYCAGALRGDIGSVDDGEVSMRCADSTGIGSSNWTWLAADVRFVTNACGLEDCEVRRLTARPGSYPACASVRATDDLCMDTSRRVFVRRAGARPVDADFTDSF